MPKKVSKERRARDGETHLGFLFRGGEGAKLAALRQGSFLFPPRNKNPRRHLGQKRQRPNHRGFDVDVVTHAFGIGIGIGIGIDVDVDVDDKVAGCWLFGPLA